MKGMNSIKSSLGVFSLSHLVVDFACFYILMGNFSLEAGSAVLVNAGFLLYNFCAFALQVPIGFLADKLQHSHGWFALVGCGVVFLGAMFEVFPWAQLVVMALGNASFHIGGGIDSLVFARGHYARSGIFISFGALGVALGSICGRAQVLSVPVLLLLLGACIILIARFGLLVQEPYLASFDLAAATIKSSEIVIYLALVAIIVRAVVGAYTPLPWKTTELLVVLAALMVFAGKLVGGLLADRLGARRVVVASLAVSAPLLAFANSQMLLSCLGLFCFNQATAVTLCVIVAKLPQNPGLGFGLTTLALFVGTALSFFVALSESLRPVLACLLIIIAIVCLVLAVPGKQQPETPGGPQSSALS